MSGARELAVILGLCCAGLAPAAEARNHRVAIENMKFTPEALEVKVGDTVIWTNKDIVPHTATATQKAFDSGPIATNAEFKFRAKRAGELAYVCLFHPTMKATVKVAK